MGDSDPTPAPQPAPGQPLPVQSLDYRTPPSDTRRRNLVLVLLFVGLGIGALMALVLVRATRMTVAAPAIVVTPMPAPAVSAPVVDYEQMRREQAYEGYLTFAARADTVVYDEDLVRASKLLIEQPEKHRQTSYGSIDPGWASSFDRPVIEMSPGDVTPARPFIDPMNPQDRVTLFVGKLISPGGNARLAFLDMRITLNGGRQSGQKSEAEYEVRIGRKLEYRIFDARGLLGFPNQLRTGKSLTVETPADTVPVRWIDGTLRADRPANSALQIFAGMLDPKDPSHCTIDYDRGGQRGSIDVYLTDDDFLRVLPRTGRVDGGTWDVGAAPASAESVERPATQPAP
jgi:hypothetical protein